MGDIKPSHRGLLHRILGVPEGEKIPLSRLMRDKRKAKKAGNTAELKRDQYALNNR